MKTKSLEEVEKDVNKELGIIDIATLVSKKEGSTETAIERKSFLKA